jgi:hypothetical protein
MALAGLDSAHAQCVDCAEWQRDWDYSAQFTAFAFADGLLAHGVGGKVIIQDPVEGTALSTFQAGGIARTPAAVDLGPPGFPQYYLFVAAGTGLVYKLDLARPLPAILPVATNGMAPQVRDLRRDSCPSDTFLAEPVVQRRADSNAQFTLDKDIVIVATAHGCGDTTQNQVIALDATDVTADPLWVFNNNGGYEVAAFRSCLLDLSRNRLVCGAEVPNGAFQNSVFSIDTNDGSLAWAAAPGVGIHARAAFGTAAGPGATHLYVGDMSGHVRSYDADDGTPRGDVSVVSIEDGIPKWIDEDLATAAGLYAGLVLAVSSDGVLHALFDAGSELIPAWDTHDYANGVITAPAIVEELGKVYVGRNDSKFHQVDLSSGTDEAGALIAPGGLSLEQTRSSDMQLTAYLGDDHVHHVAATFSLPFYMRTRQYRVPCRYGTPCVWNDTIFQAGFD